jgi:hypothetical protein
VLCSSIIASFSGGKGVPNGSQTTSLERILLAIKDREQIASDCQIASLAR